MDELTQRFVRLVEFLGERYKLRIACILTTSSAGWNPGKFFAVRNLLVSKSLYVNCGTYEDIKSWSDEQVCRQVLAVLGLLNTIEREQDMPIYDQQLSRAQKEQAGRETAEILLPFLRTDVPFRLINRLGMLVSTWSGCPDDANFTNGFMEYFFQFRETNNNIPEIGGRHDDQETESTTTAWKY